MSGFNDGGGCGCDDDDDDVLMRRNASLTNAREHVRSHLVRITAVDLDNYYTIT